MKAPTSFRFPILWLAFLAAVACPGCRGPAGQGPEVRRIRVLTYNIHHGEGVDGRLDLGRIAAVIRDSGADLVFLQEVDRATRRTGGVDQAAELGRLTGHHAVFGESMPHQGGGYGNALLSRWPLLGPTTHPLPASPDREPRSVLTASVRPGDHGPAIRLAVTHLDHTRDDTDRRAQGARLRELLEEPDGDPVILAGDFNATPEAPPMPELAGAWRDAAAGDPAATVPVGSPTRRIDYILLRPGDRWEVVRTRVLTEAVASDHRAVLAELVWRGGAGINAR